jgi:heat shock protein HslJ
MGLYVLSLGADHGAAHLFSQRVGSLAQSSASCGQLNNRAHLSMVRAAPAERGTGNGQQTMRMGLMLAAAAGVVGAAWTGPTLAQSADPRTPPPPSTVPQPRQEVQFPLGASWTAVSLNGRPIGGERPTMVVDDQLRAKGFAGCNTYSATAFPLRENGFAVGPVAVTKRACDNATMASERSFLTALRGARRWGLQEGRLVLQGTAGEIRFERAI